MEGLTHMDECVGKLNLMLDDELITHEAQFLKRNGLVYIFLKPKAFKEAISSETIQEKLASMIRLSNGIAHNLRSPLMTLMNIADYMSLFLNKWHEMYNHDHKNCPFLIKQAEMNSILLQMQEDMMSNIVMMSDIINSLKIYGKTDRLNEYQTIDIVDLIGNVSKMVEYNAKVEVEIKIKCNLRGNRQLYCIPSDMQVVFVNLFENAIDQIQTSRKDGIIEITVTHHKDSIQIKMRDNGGGIPKDLLTTNQLFEPFATKKIGGTGLGLHSCFKIIKEHRGNIYARNHKAKMGAGAEFLIVLPIDWRRHNDRVR
jgi:signal transduction histidine kinase